jgi:hypothetical protein
MLIVVFFWGMGIWRSKYSISEYEVKYNQVLTGILNFISSIFVTIFFSVFKFDNNLEIDVGNRINFFLKESNLILI